MAAFNKVLLMGNLTRDPEARSMPSGTRVTGFTLAVNRKYRTQDNELKDDTLFIDIEAFGQQAELIERHCSKGSPLFVEGRLRLEKWKTATGENRSKISVMLENFQFISPPAADAAKGEDKAF